MEQLAFDVIGKVCTKCGKWKPLNSFHRHKASKYGYRPTCKSCRSVPKTRSQLESQKLEALGFRRCRECKRLKSLEEFFDYGTQKGRYYTCKICMHPDRIYKQERNQLLQDGKKRCNTCDEIKALSEFRFRADRETYAFECKLCRNNRAKEYDARTPDKAKVRRQRWLDKKLVEDPNYSHSQYIKHRERDMARRRIYYAENKERLRAYSRQYYIENKGKVKAYQRKYNVEHPDKIKVRGTIRRTRQTQAGGSFTVKEWKDLCEKYSNKCLCCGITDKPLTHDHIIPVSKGGSSNIENLQPLCKPCNCSKRDKIIDYRPDHQ